MKVGEGKKTIDVQEAWSLVMTLKLGREVKGHWMAAHWQFV